MRRPRRQSTATGRSVAGVWRGRRTPGIRIRVTVVAALAVAAVLSGAAFSLLTVQRSQLTGAVDASLVQRADDLAVLITGGGDLPVVLPASGDDTTVAQVVSTDGTVLAASRGMSEPVTIGLPDNATQVIQTTSVRPFDDPFRLLTRQVVGDAGPLLLHVGENLDDVREATATLGASLALMVPVTTLLLAALIWLLVGRTLRPVETIRSEVAAFSGFDLHRRVPLPDADDEIGRLASTMNQMLDRIEDAVQRQQRLVADASHELRTPLTRIRAEIEVELARGDHRAPPVLLRSVLDEAVTLQRLVDDLLLLARSDAGLADVRWQPLDLDDIVLGEARRLRTNGRVTVDSAGVSAAAVNGDPDQLRRALRNLTANAERHAATTVTLSLTERDERAHLVVANDGPPIPPDRREQIFERFTRLDDARARDAGGAGLGLPITRDIIARHGGSVHVDSERQDGAAFVIDLPLAQPAPTSAQTAHT